MSLDFAQLAFNAAGEVACIGRLTGGGFNGHPDGDALTYSATGLPPGLGIDPATGLIAGTLGFDATGAYGVTVTVSAPVAT